MRILRFAVRVHFHGDANPSYYVSGKGVYAHTMGTTGTFGCDTYGPNDTTESEKALINCQNQWALTADIMLVQIDVTERYQELLEAAEYHVNDLRQMFGHAPIDISPRQQG